MFETSTIELSKKALKNNLNFIRKNLSPGQRFCSVVKGNAYGHGTSEYVQMAMNAGVDYFAVHAADEAYQLVSGTSKKPDLFIIGSIENAALEWAIKEDIELAVFDFQRLEKIKELARKLNKKARIHIEIETGMQRTGFTVTQIPSLLNWLNVHKGSVLFHGLFTHFAGAESQANHFRISSQIQQFKLIHSSFESNGLTPVYSHSACSAAIFNYPDAPGNLVRAGIVQFGFWPNKETQIRYYGDTENTPDDLKRIIRWTTRVMAVQQVAKGQYIGYGTSYLALKNMKIAILPVGYAHGYSRNLSNIGSVLIHGKSAPIVGTINMNSMTVDVNGIDGVEMGTNVVLIGKQKGKSITVNSFSEQSNLLNYEMLTRLSPTIPRIITQ
ncbi:MAG: alanine racemase [Saprospiraceae bacterium]|nr:alanine racemase [Saprospiraceae bacterium]